MPKSKIDYEQAEEWKDVVPIPQDEGGPNPLAAIAYTDEYSQAMSYLRALMASNEKSMRAMNLTEHIIRMNPAHYTVWLYRADIISTLSLDLEQELTWLNTISMRHLKNYQIWGHRQVIMSRITTLPSAELPFLAQILARDAKNYHVWSYRQWLVQHFGLWPTASDPGSELPFVESLLISDVRNNSAWNHRYFVLFGNEKNKLSNTNVVNDEMEYAKAKIALAPQNAAAWNYLKGVARKQGPGIRSLEGFALKYADPDNEIEIKSSHALDLLADIWTQNKHNDKALRALDLLGEKYDPIRKNYWDYRKVLLGTGVEKSFSKLKVASAS